MKPVINLDELEMKSHEDGPFKETYGPIAEKIGGKKLGYSLSVVPPGSRACPFHNHHVNEEMFLILEGTGVLRFGEEKYPLRKHDIIACPPGKRDVAHQIINTGKTDLKYLSLSTNEPHEICEYPDSNKVMAFVSGKEGPSFRHLFKIEQAVPYMEGETKLPPGAD